MAKTQREIDDERKENEYHDLMRLSQYSPLIKIRALDAGRGHPPTRYEIVYTCRGYRKPGEIADRFVVRMRLPAAYPRELPYFEYDEQTPIYHPHVFENFYGRQRWICIGHQNDMAVGLPLREYVIGVGEMIQWRRGVERGVRPVDERSLVGREPEPERPQPSMPPVTPPQPPSQPREEPLVIVFEPPIPKPSQPPAPAPSPTQPPTPGREDLIIVVKEPTAEPEIVITLDEGQSKAGEEPVVIEILE